MSYARWYAYNPIQGQGHEPFKAGNLAIFKSYLLRHLQRELATDHIFLNLGTISKFDRAGLVFVSHDFEVDRNVSCEESTISPRAGLILYCDVCSDICHQVLDLYSKTPHPHKDLELSVSSTARAQAAVASADDSQSRLTPRTPQTPKSVYTALFFACWLLVCWAAEILIDLCCILKLSIILFWKNVILLFLSVWSSDKEELP